MLQRPGEHERSIQITFFQKTEMNDTMTELHTRSQHVELIALSQPSQTQPVILNLYVYPLPLSTPPHRPKPSE